MSGQTPREEFIGWFVINYPWPNTIVINYPGPNTIISDPNWHAPKIFRAATHRLDIECARLALEKAELVKALETIKMRAHSEEPAEELEDAQRDLRHIYATALAVLARIDALLETGRWIPVTERLPEVGDAYLTLINGGPHDEIPEVAHFSRNFESPNPWSHSRGTAKVIYWQPLPPLPEAKK